MSIKVLAVDDEDDVRRLIQIKLKKAGFEVITAANGEEGVAKCQVGEARRGDHGLDDAQDGWPHRDGQDQGRM